MTDNVGTEIIVFYAWQNNLPASTNKNVIRYALREASSLTESELAAMNLRVVLDEATRGEPGSPNIPSTILAKIDAADIFVCDVTPINGAAIPKLPNPNVVFELGYAVSSLGWGRVIMLFNKNFGTFPDDMPFDFDRHRASPYLFAQPSKNAKKKNLAELRQPLVDTLRMALKAIIEKAPEKPVRLTGEGDEKRARDISNLEWLMSKIHIPTLDEHIDELPYKIHNRIFYFWEDFNSVASGGLFHLYDEDAKRMADDLRNAWGSTLSYGHCYRSPPERDVCFFDSGPLDVFTTPEQGKAWRALGRHRKRLFEAFRALLNHVRANYVEINLDDLSHKAWVGYVDFMKKMAAELEEHEPISDKTEPIGSSEQ
jgi:hypothetical protein